VSKYRTNDELYLFVVVSDQQSVVNQNIGDNTITTEDLTVADLNADGKPDIIAAGRATKNLMIYWNKSKK
jgi:hypothetical protein